MHDFLQVSELANMDHLSALRLEAVPAHALLELTRLTVRCM